MKLNFSIKQKLIFLLIGVITLSLVLAGGLLSSLHQRFYLEETVAQVHHAHTVLTKNLQSKEDDLLINAAEISQDSLLISSVNMITQYQSVEEYQAIIFDEEKKKLITRLAGHMSMADFDLVAIYGSQGELISFSMQKDLGFLLGIVSYEQSEAKIYLSGSEDRNSWTESSLPPLVELRRRQGGGKQDTIQYNRLENGFALLVTLPIGRLLPDGTAKIIGFVEISNFLGQDFVARIANQTQMDFQLITPDVNIGDLPLGGYQQQLLGHSHQLMSSHGEQVECIENEDFLLHSHSLRLQDDSQAYFIFGKDKGILKAQVLKMRLALLAVLITSGLFCLPLGLYVARKTITAPIEHLLEGVNALRNGSFERPIAVVTNGEIGVLAQSFNDMGQAIKQREVGLQRAKEEWERTFDSISDIITIQDKEFRITLANQATCDFFDLNRTEIQGQFCYKLFHDKETPCLGCPTLKTLEDNKTHSAEMVCDHKQDKRNLLFCSSPIFDDDGECVGIVYSGKDVTETRELETRLQQAQKMEAIGTLAGGIAHDFNNILTPILGYSEMLVDTLPEGGQERTDAEQVLKAANRAKELVKQILTFSRQTEQERNPVQVHLIIKEALKLMRSSMSANIEIKSEIAAGCRLVLADPTQIHQVLMNLCTNSYHSMRESGGVLTVSLSEVDIAAEDYIDNLTLQSGTYLKMMVRDTGHGMDKSVVDKIFEPYFTTKKKGEGTGLGLSVVHGIVKSHHGQITVYSEPEQGTEFHVYLPCIDHSIERVREQQEIPRGHQEKVLVVDDEEAIAKLLGSMLSKLDYQVIVKSNSAAALETFRDEYKSIDLVVTDMSMPGMSGAELAVELLKIKPGQAIILCTGFSEVINEEKAKAVGFKAFLLKPVLQSQLALAAREALKAS